jgi:hypothetical protein
MFQLSRDLVPIRGEALVVGFSILVCGLRQLLGVLRILPAQINAFRNGEFVPSIVKQTHFPHSFLDWSV